MAMSTLPCLSFIPMVFDEMLFCSSCGYSSDFHLTNPIDQVIHFSQLYPQQAYELSSFPPLMNEQWVQPHPLAHFDNGNNVVRKSLSNQLLQDETFKHRVFSPEQVRLMVQKACALNWNLKGLSQDTDIDQFCKEIGVARVQFNKWVYRTRKRLGWCCGTRRTAHGGRM